MTIYPIIYCLIAKLNPCEVLGKVVHGVRRINKPPTNKYISWQSESKLCKVQTVWNKQSLDQFITTPLKFAYTPAAECRVQSAERKGAYITYRARRGTMMDATH